MYSRMNQQNEPESSVLRTKEPDIVALLPHWRATCIHFIRTILGKRRLTVMPHFLSKSSWFWTRNIHKRKMLNPMPKSKNQEQRSRIPAWRPSPLSFTFDLLPPTPLTSWAMARLGFWFPVVERHGRWNLMKVIDKDDDILHTIWHTLTKSSGVSSKCPGLYIAYKC